MADDQKSRTSSRRQPRSKDWPTLIVEVVDDVVRIAQAEFRLFQAELDAILLNATDRLLSSVLTLVAFVIGGLCLLAAFTVFTHRWLPWSASLALTGVLIVGAGVLNLRLSKLRRTSRLPAELEPRFRRDPSE